MSTAADRTYTTTVGSQELELPLVALSDELTIALLITVDLGVAFAETAGRELAELMRPPRPEIIVSVATMGIPLAIEASRALGVDDYVILHKTPKIHLGETWPSRSTPSRRTHRSACAWIRPGSMPSAVAGWPSSTTSSPRVPRSRRHCASSGAWTPSRSSSGPYDRGHRRGGPLGEDAALVVPSAACRCSAPILRGPRLEDWD